MVGRSYLAGRRWGPAWETWWVRKSAVVVVRYGARGERTGTGIIRVHVCVVIEERERQIKSKFGLFVRELLTSERCSIRQVDCEWQ